MVEPAMLNVGRSPLHNRPPRKGERRETIEVCHVVVGGKVIRTYFGRGFSEAFIEGWNAARELVGA